MSDIRTDFENLKDGDRVTLHPRANNPLHKRPKPATYDGGFFYLDIGVPSEGPDYYLGDVMTYCEGFTLGASAA